MLADMLPASKAPPWIGMNENSFVSGSRRAAIGSSKHRGSGLLRICRAMHSPGRDGVHLKCIDVTVTLLA